MQEVQQLRQNRTLSTGIAIVMAIAAMVVSGLVGYMVRGTTTVVTRTTVSAPRLAEPAALNADSAGGYGATILLSAPSRALNGDSASGY